MDKVRKRRISFRNINLKSIAGQKADEIFNRDFEVYIDSASGCLLKITCTHGTPSPEECPVLMASVAEKQINMTSEKYVGFPEVIPSINFSDAILAGAVNPFSVEEILGQYVMYTDGGCEPRPVWIISFCGTPPTPIIEGDADWIPIYQRTRVRKVVDAIDGRVFFVSNVPTAPLKPEDRERIFPKEKDNK